MVIGIYKFGKKVYFYDNIEDHSSWSIEVTQIAKLFVSKGHHVIILSETDLKSSEHLTTRVDRAIDRIYVFNGTEPTADILEGLKAISNDIRLIITDLKLIPSDLSIYSHIYTQSSQLYEYGAIEKAILFNNKKKTKENKSGIYFGGTERNRLNDIIEYVYRPNVEWCGKSEYFNFKNYIPYSEHCKKLASAKYTIVIGDETYNQIGFVTPRFYEAIKYGVIPFVDAKFDTDELILQRHHFLRVSSYKEMMDKIHQLEARPRLCQAVLSEIKALAGDGNMIAGNDIYLLIT